MTDHPTLDGVLATLEHAAKDLRGVPVDVLAMPDASGRLRAVEITLAEVRRGWNAATLVAVKDPENPLGPETFPAERTLFGTVKPRVVGTQYRTVTKRSAKRTYSTAAILKGAGDSEHFAGSPLEALMAMLREGAVRLDYVWGEFEKFCRRYGLPMRVVEGAITDDGDVTGPWVGEVWKETVSQEAVKDDGTPVK